MSKKQLGELASRLGVSGRSKMSRPQLEDAVRKAQDSGGGRRAKKAS